ncbi:MAG: DNA alkylation repair protein [Candidatus Cloacimonadaceae bacterium]|nr:DNA alkylation repair protein [Candidatus Cloacimonadaceae bacterium]
MNNKELFLQEMLISANPAKVPGAMGFFKTAKGEYGEGDLFWGLTVPQQRTISKKYYKLLTLDDLGELIRHEVHEVRLTTLMMMVTRYQKCPDDLCKEGVARLYLDNLDFVNNWDLVDSSAHHILGDWFFSRYREQLFALARSGHLWRQRVAVIATFGFIRRGDFGTTFELAKLLMDHKHDLIHKALGWMLREIGNLDYNAEYRFLAQHYSEMPRTMLRYAIEKFDEKTRQDFLKGRI